MRTIYSPTFDRATFPRDQIPFASFVLTYQGYVEEQQLGFNASKVKAIGVTLADEQEGPFQLKLDYFKALRLRPL